MCVEDDWLMGVLYPHWQIHSLMSPQWNVLLEGGAWLQVGHCVGGLAPPSVSASSTMG